MHAVRRAGSRALSVRKALDRGVAVNDATTAYRRSRFVDDATAAAWITWLRTMDWDFFATCAFGHATSPHAALKAATEWLAPLPRAYAAVGLQRGPGGNRLHVHAMVGGTGRRPLIETLLRDSWRHGNLDLKRYSPLKGAVEYVVRQADEIEIIGSPRVFRPRRRG